MILGQLAFSVASMLVLFWFVMLLLRTRPYGLLTPIPGPLLYSSPSMGGQLNRT
jgi:hypothetical protein